MFPVGVVNYLTQVQLINEDIHRTCQHLSTTLCSSISAVDKYSDEKEKPGVPPPAKPTEPVVQAAAEGIF